MSTGEFIPVISNAAASRIMPRIEELAGISESDHFLSRRFASEEHRRANTLVAGWMQAAGMDVREDAIGNVIGRYSSAGETANPATKTQAILLGSHLDTVIDGGRFDGMLGVLSALACVETLVEKKIHLPYALEVIGFADEEGVRYQSTYLGSRAVTGDFDTAVFKRTDNQGILFTDALKDFGSDSNNIPPAKRDPEDFLAYLELHIEQGPVLEHEDQAVGVVTGIAGATRLTVSLSGLAGHAGTVPMNLRQDALAAAAQCIAVVEKLCSTSAGLVGTVGRIDAQPGAGNVIPGFVEFSVDIRALGDELRHRTVEAVTREMTELCASRNIKIAIDKLHEAHTVTCDDEIVRSMGEALADEGMRDLSMPSGAGHDAAAMAAITPVGMLFVRCAGGVSHHPAESVTPSDAVAGANVLMRSVIKLCNSKKQS